MELELEAAKVQVEADAEGADLGAEEADLGAKEGDLDAESGGLDTDMQTAIENKLSAMLTLRKRLFAKASKNIKEAQERYKKDYDRKRSKPEVGSLSLYCNWYQIVINYCSCI